MADAIARAKPRASSASDPRAWCRRRRHHRAQLVAGSPTSASVAAPNGVCFTSRSPRARARPPTPRRFSHASAKANTKPGPLPLTASRRRAGPRQRSPPHHRRSVNSPRTDSRVVRGRSTAADQDRDPLAHQRRRVRHRAHEAGRRAGPRARLSAKPAVDTTTCSARALPASLSSTAPRYPAASPRGPARRRRRSPRRGSRSYRRSPSRNGRARPRPDRSRTMRTSTGRPRCRRPSRYAAGADEPDALHGTSPAGPCTWPHARPKIAVPSRTSAAPPAIAFPDSRRRHAHRQLRHALSPCGADRRLLASMRRTWRVAAGVGVERTGWSARPRSAKLGSWWRACGRATTSPARHPPLRVARDVHLQESRDCDARFTSASDVHAIDRVEEVVKFRTACAALLVCSGLIRCQRAYRAARRAARPGTFARAFRT